MSEKENLIKKLNQAYQESLEEIKASPQAETGKCVIRTKGWSECKDNMTESACKRQAGPGYTATWTKGATC